MRKRSILVVNGHPDPGPERFCHALANAYEAGARGAEHEVVRLDLGDLDFPLLRSRREWEDGVVAASVTDFQEKLGTADHLVLVYPLWLGEMPAVLKALLEQALRPGFAFSPGAGAAGWKPLMKGRSARIVVTMGMPAPIYRHYFRAHSLKALERNILGFCGFAPVRASIVGNVESRSAAHRTRWLKRVGRLGRAAR